MHKRDLTLGVLLIAGIALASCHGGGGVPAAGGSVAQSSAVSAAQAQSAAVSAAQNIGTAGYTDYVGPASLSNFEWGRSMLRSATYVGPVTGDAGMVMHIVPQLQSGPGLISFARAVNQPGSGQFRHFITAKEIGQRFGASTATIKKIATYFKQYGIRTGGWPQNLALNVKGTMSQFASAFGTKFAWYEVRVTGHRCGAKGGSCTIRFLGPTVQPHTATALPMTAVQGMLRISLLGRDAVLGGPGGTCTECNGFGLTAGQMRNAFDFTEAYNPNNENGSGITANGSGVTTGIIGTGPICTGSGAGLCAAAGGITTDIGAYYLYANNSPSNIAPVNLMPVVDQAASTQNGGTGTGPYDPLGGSNLSTPPTPTTSKTCTISSTSPNDYSCNPEDAEAQLDIEQEATLAPGATVDFYLAYERTCYDSSTGGFQSPAPQPTGTTCPTGYVVYDEEGIDLTDDEIQEAIADNVVDSIAMSYGEGEDAACYGGYLGTSGGTATAPTCTSPTTGLGPLEFAALNAEGIAAFASTGDSANSQCQNGSTGAAIAGYCVSYPATDPSVVAVGAVNAAINEAGQLLDQLTVWGTETDHGATEGGAGGASLYFPESSVPFQNPVGSTIPCYVGQNNLSCPYTTRTTPDVSLIGDTATGVLVSVNAADGSGEGLGSSSAAWIGGAFGGTSVSAQQVAAQWADVLSYCKQVAACDTATGAHPWRLGNPNTYYYGLVNAAPTAPTGPGAWGSNGGIYNVQYGADTITSQTACCYAGPGYSPATGLGVPFTYHLARGTMHVLGIAGY